jgi:hypothetical protein
MVQTLLNLSTGYYYLDNNVIKVNHQSDYKIYRQPSLTAKQSKIKDLTAPEFDTHLNDSISEFKDTGWASNYTLNQKINMFIGNVSSTQHTNDFFNHLVQLDFDRWKVATKQFYKVIN